MRRPSSVPSQRPVKHFESNENQRNGMVTCDTTTRRDHTPSPTGINHIGEAEIIFGKSREILSEDSLNPGNSSKPSSPSSPNSAQKPPKVLYSP